MDFETYLSQPLEFEAEIKRYLIADSPSVIFEIGACEGEDTIKLRRLFPRADIHIFEPLPKNLPRVRANLKKYGVNGVKVNQVALSQQNGSADFYVSAGQPDHLPKAKDWDYGNKSSSLLPPKEHLKVHKWLQFKDKIKVKTQRLDDYCQKHQIEKIDFVFLDVQGAELQVLEGAGDFIKRIGCIWLEVENIELYKDQPLKADVEQFMAKHGFEKVKDTVGKIAGDQFYVNRALVGRPKKTKSLLSRFKWS